MDNSITVITITRNRPDLLRRAIATVQNQKCFAYIKHLVLVDDCENTKTLLENFENFPPNLTWRWMPRKIGEYSGPGRSSRLRNYGVRISNTKWIAFLDDDNEWLENHLSELLNCAMEKQMRAIHSHMILLNRDGTPFLENRLPWCRNLEEARKKYDEMCAKGVFTPGSCIVKDKADPIDHPDPVRTVDTGEWLLARELLLEVPFQEFYTPLDEVSVTGEDDKLLMDLINRKEPIACTMKATLMYYLGGYSNNFKDVYDSTFMWCQKVD